MGVHDLALKSDPRLRAAEFRREATGENRKIARANLLPQIKAPAPKLGLGRSPKRRSQVRIWSLDTDHRHAKPRYTEALLIQSLYRQANYESLDIARGQITQADAIYEIAYQDFLLRVSETIF